MRLINVQEMEGYSKALLISVSLRQFKRDAETDQSKIQAFKDKWLSHEATLLDWMKIGPINLKAFYKGLSKTQERQLQERQLALYTLWLECNLQFKRLVDFKNVLEKTPDQTRNYALSEIERIQLQIDRTPKNKSYDIHDSEALELNELLHYKSFLESFLLDPYLEIDRPSINELLEKHFPDTIALLQRAQVEVDYDEMRDDGRTFSNLRIVSINSHDSRKFRAIIKAVINSEYIKLIHSVIHKSTEHQEAYLNELLEHLIEVENNFLEEDSYKYQLEETKEIITVRFKRLKKIGIIGTNSYKVALRTGEGSIYNSLLRSAEPLFLIIESEIKNLTLKIQQYANNLQTVNISKGIRLEVSSINLSFKYTGKYDNNLTDFIRELRNSGFIEKSTPMPSAKRIFTGRGVDDAVIWKGTIGQLKWLIKYLIDSSGSFEPVGNRIWEITSHCFIQPGAIKLTQEQLRKAKLPPNTSKLQAICNLLLG